MSVRPLQLDDAAFWVDPRVHEDREGDRLSAESFRGLLLDGPSVVPLAERATLPLAGWYGLTGAEREAGGPRSWTVLVGACLETGEVRAGLAMTLPGGGPPKKPTPIPPEARAEQATQVAYGMFDLDARERLRLPWSPGTWCFRALLREHASAPVRVRLEGPPGPPPAGPAAPSPPDEARAARWRDVPDAPPVPGRAGIALAADRAVVFDEPGAAWRVRLGWRLPVRAHERVAEPQGDGPRAVVPLSLVIVDTFLPGARLVPLRVPCHDLAGDEGTGQLELDLLRVSSVVGAGTAFIYAAAGDVLTGPARTALVSAQSLPRDRRRP